MFNEITTDIERLYYHYAYGIDGGDFEGVAQLLKNASIRDQAGNALAQGAEQIKQFYQRIIIIYPDSNTPKTQHVISNVLIVNASDDTLTAQANYSVFQKQESAKIEAIICGQYRSVFKRTTTGWEFYQHQTVPLMVGDMTRHLKISIQDIVNQQIKDQ